MFVYQTAFRTAPQNVDQAENARWKEVASYISQGKAILDSGPNLLKDFVHAFEHPFDSGADLCVRDAKPYFDQARKLSQNSPAVESQINRITAQFYFAQGKAKLEDLNAIGMSKETKSMISITAIAQGDFDAAIKLYPIAKHWVFEAINSQASACLRAANLDGVTLMNETAKKYAK